MTTKGKTEGEFFVLAIDKERNRAMAAVLELVIYKHAKELQEKFERMKVDVSAFEALLDEFADGVHDNDWCEDPDCLRK